MQPGSPFNASLHCSQLTWIGGIRSIDMTEGYPVSPQKGNKALMPACTAVPVRRSPIYPESSC
jgi:hypothetical protein